MQSKYVMIKRISVFMIIASCLALIVLPLFSGKSPLIDNYSDITRSDLAFNNEYSWDNSTGYTSTSVNSLYSTVKFSDLYAYIESEFNKGYTLSRDTTIANYINSQTANKKVSLYTADDLYNLSRAASYNWTAVGAETRNRQAFVRTIAALLNLNYILHNDIDYSAMRSRQFIPLGINIPFSLDQSSGTSVYYPFTGSFDGNGYTIKNLYFAGYDYVTTVYNFEGTDESNDIEVPIITYYSMFAYVGTTGVIGNLTLSDPILELLDTHEDLSKTAIVAGENRGLIYNVSVIDVKMTGNTNNSGIRFNIPSGVRMTGEITASGFVHTNRSTGRIYNSYYVSQYVIAANYADRFETEPFYYYNEGTIANVAYDSSVYSTAINGVPTKLNNINQYTTQQLQTGLIGGNSIAINNTIPSLPTTMSVHNWRYYQLDGYPILLGLTYNDSQRYFEIRNEYDFTTMISLLAFSTPHDGKFYNQHEYVIMNDVNFSNILFYNTADTEFNGILRGVNTSVGQSNYSNNIYLTNLTINIAYVSLQECYYGLFSVLNGTIKDLNLLNCKIEVVNNTSYYEKIYNIGLIAGETRENAEISGISINSTVASTNIIDLGSEAINSANVGSIVGKASGLIERVVNYANIYGGIHNYNANQLILGDFAIGGLVGATGSTPLLIKRSVNRGNILGIATESGNTAQVMNNAVINIYIGGIIGLINNTTATNTNGIYYVSNYANVIGAKFLSRVYTYQNIGGIFGLCMGYANEITTTEFGQTVIKNGSWQNHASSKVGVNATSYNSNERYYTAGIGVAGNNQMSEYSILVNDSSFQFGLFNASVHNSYVYYSSTILDNSSDGIRLSRAYNTTSYTYDNTYFSSMPGNGSIIQIAPFFVSVNNNKTELIYCQNDGVLRIGSGTAVTLRDELRVAGITLSTRVDYRNIYQTADIIVTNFMTAAASSSNNERNIYVSGISWVLPNENNHIYTAENCLNEGNIYTAGIGLQTATSAAVASQTNFRRTVYANNLYVAGLFIINNGYILNSMNYGNISSTYENIQNITGTCNTFVGGLITFNYNLVKDCANSGNIMYVNTNATGSGTVVASATNYAGIVYSYYAGITIGGIVAAFGDINATIIGNYRPAAANQRNYYGRVEDSSNNGDIFGKSQFYARCGGVVGVALGVELCAGTSTATTSSTTGIYASNISGNSDPIGNCVLSNGLNFVDIYAITAVIATYSSTETTATAERPGIYSCAGGVIGYGLCVMTRMLNHGSVAATDVAGGVVGATYVLGDITTTANINSAVHYGTIRALNNSNFANINYPNIVTNTSYDRPKSWINAAHSTYAIQLRPYQKRGFGGIFGRLQRGLDGIMQANTFSNVMNCDPDIDFIGRLDQVINYTSSIRFFRFVTTASQVDSYYTANPNDQTQAVFAGYYRQTTSASPTASYTVSAPIIKITVRATTSTAFVVSNIKYENGDANSYISGTRTFVRYIGNNLTQSNRNNYEYVSGTGTQNLAVPITQATRNATSMRSFLGLASSVAMPTNGNSIEYTIDATTFSFSISLTSSTSTSTSDSVITTFYPFQIPRITENPEAANIAFQYIYDSSFPLMSEANSDYIYYATNDVLADRFRLPTSSSYRPNGMYVLASTEGRIAGSVLPANLNIENLYKLDESNTGNEREYLDLDNITSEHLDVPLEGESGYMLVEKYRQMFQVRYNEQSSVLNQEGSSTLADLVLYDPSGNAPTLTGGTLNESTKTITFTVSSQAFGGITNPTVSYKVLSATLSRNAVIAQTGLINAIHGSAFNTAYRSRTDNIIRGTFEATINQTLSAGTNTINNAFRVYSELISEVTSLMSNSSFYTDYNIVIVVQASHTITFSQARFLNSTTTTVSNPALTSATNTYTIGGTAVLHFDRTFEARFTDSSGYLPIGHKITVHSVYWQESSGSTEYLLDPLYYTIEYTAKVSGNNYLYFTIRFNENVKSGLIRIVFSYYDTGTMYNIVFTKAASTARAITSVDYDTFSSDLAGTSTQITPATSAFTTYIAFDVLLRNTTTATQTLTINSIINTATENYLYDEVYYDLLLGGVSIIRVRLSDFAQLTNATIRYAYSAGKRVFTISYTTTSASGASGTFNQTINERDLPELITYHGNFKEINPYYVEVEREALNTNIYFDFGFYSSTFNNNVIANISGNVDEFHTFTYGNFLEMHVSYDLGPGSRSYQFIYSRENGTVNYVIATVTVNKLYGTDPYLKDINFQIAGSITSYPSIWLSNASGTQKIESPRPQIYYDGIDYLGLDAIDGTDRYFRIEGIVSNIDLQNYVPQFYLPAGAVIERYDPTTGQYVSVLETDYIGYDENSDTLILYRITSEDGQNRAYYHIMAIDVVYNLTVRFEVYYRFNDGRIVNASDPSSPINGNVILITTKNYNITEEFIGNFYTKPIEFPYAGGNAYTMIDPVNTLATQSTQFFVATENDRYLYTFGRGLSGCYGFSVVTPICTQPTDQDKGITNGQRYLYSVYLLTGLNNGVSSTNLEEYRLDDLGGDYVGKYFFIEQAAKTRIRNFAIVIEEETVGNKWGLYDDSTSWDK